MFKIKIEVLVSLIMVLSLMACISGTRERAVEEVADIESFGEKINLDEDSLIIVAEKNYQNLQVFLIEGKFEIVDKEYKILSDALKDKIVDVKETGEVNELSINNNSDKFIFIHAGDIVKGGRQDRTLSFDVIVSPSAKDVPVASFCVESNRWHKRGSESDVGFVENTNQISSRELKVASKGLGNQQRVWQEISKQQKDLNKNMSYISNKEVDITENESSTSLQLSLENEDLDSIKGEYKKVFGGLLNEFKDAVGFAYAINGEVYGIELYNNKKLFVGQWDKLLDACIVESVSNFNKDSVFIPAQAIHVKDLMASAKKGEQEVKNINSETNCNIFKQKKAMLFITVDKGIDKWVHKNYIAIDSTMLLESSTRGMQQQMLNNELNIQELEQVRQSRQD